MPPDAGQRTNASRYLCAGAYLDPLFANKVIGELIASHRAVAPSRGIDLEPIIRHCLQARRIKLIRDIALTVLLVFGLLGARLPLLLFLVVTFFCSYLPGSRWIRSEIDRKALAKRVTTVVIGAVVIGAVVVIIVVSAATYLESKLTGSVGTSIVSGLFTVGVLGPFSLVYLLLLIGALVWYFWVRNTTLVEWLRPDAQEPPAFRRETPRVENRIAEVFRAQYGNLSLYSEEDPFVGTGFIPDLTLGRGKKDDQPAWSIVIELSRAGASRGMLGFSAGDRVSIDPVELHAVLRTRLEQLNDPALPASQQVARITVDHHVVGEGSFPWGFAVIDQHRLIPYSQVSAEAVVALIRTPQGRLRYYQRVSVSDEGSPVLTPDQRQVIGSVDREIIASAFVCVAVEGHMFYLQFIPKALPPVDYRFRDIDQIPRTSSSKFLGKVLGDALRGAFVDVTTAPYHAYQTLRRKFWEYREFNKEITKPHDSAYADVGARIGVREFWAEKRMQTTIQDLDTDKYTQIVERLVLETVLDFLVSKGADTTAYRASAASITNSTIISGNTGDWNVNAGQGTQTVVAG